jgi:hypothetical protein
VKTLKGIAPHAGHESSVVTFLVDRAGLIARLCLFATRVGPLKEQTKATDW